MTERKLEELQLSETKSTEEQSGAPFGSENARWNLVGIKIPSRIPATKLQDNRTGCVFAPYFSYHQAASHFGAVHKVFGASNVSKLLLRLPVNFRSDAAVTIAYQALARIQDPAYGCVAYIMELQQQVASIQQEIEILSHQLALNSVTSLASRGCLHASSTSNCETQLSPRPDTTTGTHCYQNQPNLQLDNSDHIAGSIELDSKMTSELLPLYGWEDQNPFWNSAYHSLDELLKGVDC